MTQTIQDLIDATEKEIEFKTQERLHLREKRFHGQTLDRYPLEALPQERLKALKQAQEIADKQLAHEIIQDANLDCISKKLVRDAIDELNSQDEIQDFWFSIGVGRTGKNSINLGDVKESIGLFSKVLKEKLGLDNHSQGANYGQKDSMTSPTIHDERDVTSRPDTHTSTQNEEKHLNVDTQNFGANHGRKEVTNTSPRSSKGCRRMMFYSEKDEYGRGQNYGFMCGNSYFKATFLCPECREKSK